MEMIADKGGHSGHPENIVHDMLVQALVPLEMVRGQVGRHVHLQPKVNNTLNLKDMSVKSILKNLIFFICSCSSYLRNVHLVSFSYYLHIELLKYTFFVMNK